MEFVLTNLKSQRDTIETYHGYVADPASAILIIKAVKQNKLRPRMERLSDVEQAAIRSGTVVVWEENISQMKRWTDGRSWSTSRLQNDFLVYQQVSPKKKPTSPYGNKLRLDGELVKRSISLTDGKQRFHLVNYYHPKDIHRLQVPTEDRKLSILQADLTNYQTYYQPNRKQSAPRTRSTKTITSDTSLSPNLSSTSIPLHSPVPSTNPYPLPSVASLLHHANQYSNFHQDLTEDLRQIQLLNHLFC